MLGVSQLLIIVRSQAGWRFDLTVRRHAVDAEACVPAHVALDLFADPLA